MASSAHSRASFFTNRTGDPLLPYGTSFIRKLAIIVDVEPTPARTFDEVRATATMLDRTKARFGIKPKRLAADTAYGTGKFLGWLADQEIEPHIPVWDKGSRDDGTFSRSDFIFDPEQDLYICPAGKVLKQFRRNYVVARTDSAHDGIRKYRASQKDCRTCELKSRCCPNMPSRNVQRFLLAAIAQNLRRMARLAAAAPD